jgi:hypothetical protein
MKMYRGVKIQIHAFLILATDGNVWIVSCSGRFTLGEAVPFTNRVRGLGRVEHMFLR